MTSTNPLPQVILENSGGGVFSKNPSLGKSDFPTHSSIDGDDTLSRMTVCIAALSNNGKEAHFCADQTITYADANLQVERPDIDKISKITDNAVVLSAGNFSATETILKGFKLKIASAIASKPFLETQEMADLLRDTFAMVRVQNAERSILEPLNLTMLDYISRLHEFPESKAIELVNNLAAYAFDAIFILAGYDSDGVCHIYKICNPGTVINCDVDGFGVVGNGYALGSYSIQKSGYNKGMDLESVRKIVLNAKKDSEYMPGIGKLLTEGVLRKEIPISPTQ